MKYAKISLVLCLLLPLFALAQRPDREEIESLRVAIFTQQMDLTPQESKAFWPIYHEYRAKMNELNRQSREHMSRLRAGVSALSDTEVEKLADSEVTVREKEAALTREYHERFKKVLPIRKVARLYGAEEAFKRELLKRLRERHNRH